MSPAAIAVLSASIAGIFGIVVAIVNAVVGRDGRRTDKMETIADSGLALATQEKSRRVECEETLSVFRRVLRALVRAIQAGDQAAIDTAYVAAVDTLDAY